MRSRPAPSSVFSAAERWSTTVEALGQPLPQHARLGGVGLRARGGLAGAGELLGQERRALTLAFDLESRGDALVTGARRVLAGGVAASPAAAAA